VGLGLGDWWAASRLKSAADGEVGLLVAPVGILMSFDHRRFGTSGKVFPAEGLRSLYSFGDSLSSGMFFAGEAEGISWGTLHGRCRINRRTVKEST
jgi:hypothetical protein